MTNIFIGRKRRTIKCHVKDVQVKGTVERIAQAVELFQIQIII